MRSERRSFATCISFYRCARGTKGRRSPTEPCGRKPISLTDAKSYAVYDLHRILRAVIYDLQKPGLSWTRTKRSRISEDAKNSTKCNYVFSRYEYGFESVIYVIEFSQFSVTKGFRLVSYREIALPVGGSDIFSILLRLMYMQSILIRQHVYRKQS